MQAWLSFVHAHARVIRRLEAEMESEQGLSLPAYEVLARLSEAPDGRLRMTDLASAASLTPSGMTRLVDKLAADGLVERARCDTDARVVYAGLTPAGMRRLRAAYPTHLRGVRTHLIDRLDSHHLESLAEALGPVARDCPPTP